MWVLELLCGLLEFVDSIELIALILRGTCALGTGLVYLARRLGQALLEGAWWLLRFGH